MSPTIRMRDGSVVFRFHNPDGSWVEIPMPDGDSEAPNAAIGESLTRTAWPGARANTPESVSQYMRDIGSRDGKARASCHNREQLAALRTHASQEAVVVIDFLDWPVLGN